MTRRRIGIYACRPAITSRSWPASLRASIRSASTSSGGSSSNGMAAEVKRGTSIWTTIVIGEVNHADDDETQAGQRRRDPGRRVYGADGPDAGRLGRGDGRA